MIAARAPISARAMFLGGAVTFAVGLAIYAIVPLTFAINILAKLLMSVGGGTAMLGALKRFSPPTPPAALPEVEPSLLAERRRRLRAILLERGAAATFEFLLEKSRWTQQAVLSTLLDMKERGEVLEDLDYDTGEWVYRLQSDAADLGLAPSLEDRRLALAQGDERP